MTQTKLEILGPYTPEHEGPWAIEYGEVYEYFVHAVVNGVAFVTTPADDRHGIIPIDLIKNAREVPVAREFWVNEYAGDSFGRLYDSASEASKIGVSSTILRTIHVREVMPGEE